MLENFTKAFFIALIIFIPIAILLILLYFLPSIIAIKKKDKNTIIIILINLFFGWTFIGWIGVLIWIINENKGGYDG